MTVRTNTIRSSLLTVVVVTSVLALGSLGGGAVQPGATAELDAAIQENGVEFENGTVVEQRGDVARFTVLFDGTDRATVTVGSPEVNFEISFDVVDGDGDGEATVAVNTAVVGLENGANETGVSALGDDEIDGFEMATEPIPGPLDAATYGLELTVDGELADVGSIVLNERSLDEMSVWTAPEEAQPNDTSELLDVVTRTDRVAQGDWAVLAIDVSGLFGYVEDVEDLRGPTYGLNVSLTEDPGRNQPERRADVSQLGLVADESNDTLFVLIDTENLTIGSEYNATFAINDSNPYLDTGENESTSATFSVVERNLTFDDTTAEGELELPAASDATLSGTTSAAPGTVIEFQLRTLGEGAFLRTEQTTVSEDGNWSVTFDLSEASNGTEFRLQTDDPSANATGVIVEAAGTETPSEETNETGTPSDAATETTETDTNETATPGEEATEEAVETTTVADKETTESSVLTAGATGSSVGLVALLVGVTLVALRRS